MNELLDIIDLSDSIYSDRPRKAGELYVSTLSLCLRKEFFLYFYRPSQIYKSDEILAGEYLHKIIQNELRQHGYEIEKAVSCELKDNFKLVGRIDAINSNHLIEIKTVKKFIDFNVSHWFLQINTYMHLAGVKKAKLLVVERPTGQMFVKDIDYDKEKAEEMIHLAEEVVDAIKNKDYTVLPRRNNYLCRCCEFNIICKRV